jgi:hypothetical protein
LSNQTQNGSHKPAKEPLISFSHFIQKSHKIAKTWQLLF